MSHALLASAGFSVVDIGMWNAFSDFAAHPLNDILLCKRVLSVCLLPCCNSQLRKHPFHRSFLLFAFVTSSFFPLKVSQNCSLTSNCRSTTCPL
jgi:hypothetical protein